MMRGIIMPLRPLRIPALSAPLFTCLVVPACGDDEKQDSFGSVTVTTAPTMPSTQGMSSGTTGGDSDGVTTGLSGDPGATLPDPSTTLPDPSATSPETTNTVNPTNMSEPPGTDSGYGPGTYGSASGYMSESGYMSGYMSEGTYGSSEYYGSEGYGSESGMYMCYEKGYDCYSDPICCEYYCCTGMCTNMGFCS